MNDTDQGETKCGRLGCEQPATLIWREKTTGETLAYCAEDGVEAFNLVTRWCKEPLQAVHLEEHKVAVERAIGGGLYGMTPGRLYRGEPGNMR